MRWSIALLFLAPTLGMASLIVTKTIVGNVVTIGLDSTSEGSQAAKLDETLVISPVDARPWFGQVNLTLWAIADGIASANGTFGEFASCRASSGKFPDPDNQTVW